MTVKIGHAVYDENGKSVGKKVGDQTGKEIRIDNWYKSGSEDGKTWDYLLICTDKALARKAAKIMEEICKNDNFGYSQPNRWTGHTSIVIHDGNIAESMGDFDCSSLVLSCYIQAGLDISATGYTGDMRQRLMKTGKFKEYKASKYVNSDAYAKVGAIYLREGHHVCMSLEDFKGAKNGYFPKYFGKSKSIVDALTFIGAESSFSYRKKIASANDISLYIGTASQNTKMLSLLSEGKLIRP